VAVFAGATSGIGLGTLKALAKYANAPRAYMIGRSKAKASHLIDKLKLVNPMATFVFIEGQFSLIKDVDKICDEIKKFETHIDILCMSPGYISLGGRQETPEGIETDLALQFYSRQRLLMNLLPLLERSSSPRVISILAASFEGPLNKDDLECRKNYNLIKASRAAATMTDFMFEEFAKQHPTISFIHHYPGEVGTHFLDNTLASASGLLWLPAQIPRYTILPVYTHLMCITPDESGERTLFLATTTRFPPTTDHGTTGKVDGFVDRPYGIGVARSTVMKEGKGNGVYRANSNAETSKVNKMLDQYREEGMGKVVYDHTIGVFEKALSAETGNGN
jgi:NAD(P)-dependent dehydrogenase (short-subunit alcohol dehydrogenase family)